jgi:general secretion pathway protein C
MTPILVRGFPAVVSVLFASAAALDAHTMLDTGPQQLRAAALMPPLPRVHRHVHPPPPAVPSTHATSAAAILARNPFDSGGPTDPPLVRSCELGIRKIGPRTHVVNRAIVDQILEEQSQLMRGARIVPEQDHGKVVGILLYGVYRGGLLDALGFENGDRLESVNGYDLTTPDGSLEAYARLRTSDLLVFVVTRRGARTSLTYHIV